MGIRINKWNLVYESVTMTPIEPPTLCVSSDRLEKYLKECPPPKDTPNYTLELLKSDLNSEGIWTVPDDISPEWDEYICDLVSAFL